MTKLVSLSNEAYSELSKLKGKKMSFSEAVLNLIKQQKEKGNIKRFAGLLKNKNSELEEFGMQIQKDRRRNLGRTT